MSQFPANPTNGQRCTLAGDTYIYSTTSKSWEFLEGSNVGLATSLSSGLMSASDYVKLQSMIVPPPHCTLRIDGHPTRFTAGNIVLKSGDQFVQIASTTELAAAPSQLIHANTYGFNFTLDVTTILQYFVDQGNLVVRSPDGPPGLDGDPGEDGEDNLTFGPDGIRGDQGVNAPVPYALQAEPVSFQLLESEPRAIINIDTEEISPDENYLVVTRGNIGNPAACPSAIKVGNLTNSTLVVALSADLPTDSATSNCLSCSGAVHYIDIAPIVGEIEAEFKREVARIKASLERVTTFWLTIMAGVFDEQKASICCALEYCKSQSRNANTRQYIEQMRVQAAVGGHGIIVDSDTTNRSKTVMDPACGAGFGAVGATGLPNNADPVGASPCVPGIVIVGDGSVQRFDQCPPGFMPRSLTRPVAYAATNALASVQQQLPNTQIHQPSTSRADIVLPSDDRYTALLQNINTKPSTRVVDKSALPIEIHVSTTNCELVFVAALGADPATVLSVPRSVSHVGSTTKFNDLLVPGTYHVALRWASTTPVQITIASQNAAIVRGEGDGWSSQSIHTISDELHAPGTSASLVGERGTTWLQIKVFSESGILSPYVPACGAVGPNPGAIDRRLCRELPTGTGNPILRQVIEPTDGTFRDWYPSACGDGVAPDALQCSLSGSVQANFILCYIGAGKYTGGININQTSVQVIVEQLRFEPGSRPTALDSKTITSSATNNDYRVTTLYWDDQSCAGPMSEFASAIGTVQDCQNWKLSAAITTNTKQVKVDLLPHKNLSDNAESAKEWIITVAGLVPGVARNAEITAPQGSYLADIFACCLLSGQQYTGQIEVEYQGPNGRLTKKFPAMGSFSDLESARRAYVGLNISFFHAGGIIVARLTNPVFNTTSGSISVRISNTNGKTLLPDMRKTSPQRRTACRINNSILDWFKQQLTNGTRSKTLISVAGQDFFAFDTVGMPIPTCVLGPQDYLALPTLDGVSVEDIPSSTIVSFESVLGSQEAIVTLRAAGLVVTSIKFPVVE